MKVFPVLATVLMLAAMSANSAAPFSSQRNSPVTVSEEAPAFTLEGQNGQKITLFDARGKSPVVLVFYRGYW